ncbi:unnamed protein product [Orchesella dallaii]|uniref:HRDC domain-containing protein n=1 Tax=Orchesella dallaii TaxID=48710 RepID=A0ABP1S7W9_9HEXA
MVSTTDLAYPRISKYIRTETELAECSIDIDDNSEITVDTEMNSDSYYHLICIIQISTQTTDYIIDALLLYDKIRQYLAHPLENPAKLKVFHSCNDLLHLQSNFGIFTVGLVDCQEAYEILRGKKQVAFHIMVKDILGSDIDKLPQLADWRLSPLPDDLLAYAAADTRLLFECWLTLKHEAVSIESEEFPASRRASLRLVSSYKTPNAHAAWQKYLTTNRADRKLYNAKHKRTYISIVSWRDTKGKEHDIHPTKIISNNDLEVLIADSPNTVEALKRRLIHCPHLHPSYYDQILEPIREGTADEAPWEIENDTTQYKREVSFSDRNSSIASLADESWEPFDEPLVSQDLQQLAHVEPTQPTVNQLSKTAKKHRPYRANIRLRQTITSHNNQTGHAKSNNLQKCINFAQQLNISKQELLNYLNQLP